MKEPDAVTKQDYGARRLSIELTNICNLHCSYCLRDEEALYNTQASFLPLDLLQKIFSDGRRVMGITNVGFTGGEPTLHPQFDRVLDLVVQNGLKFSFVTNGWHFDRIWPAVRSHRDSVDSIAFSLDGVTREEHDFWRGEGSFVRLVHAFSRCFGNDVPFNFKVALRRDTVAKLEPLALFAARMGATDLRFAHVLPNSDEFASSEILSREERQRAEQEIANLSRIFKMPIAIDVGYFNVEAAAPCSPLAGVSANIDYRGCLTLCCSLSGFRGAVGQGDVVGNLNTEDFAAAYQRLLAVADGQREARAKRLTTLAEQGITPDLVTGSPCLFCLDSFGKLPPKSSIAGTNQRSLPVFDAYNSGSSTVIN